MARVLVVDDNPVVRALVVYALEDGGMQVDEADDGVVALARIEELGAALDAIVLDLMMPGLSGHDVLERLQGSGAPPVLVLSCKTDSTDVSRALALGAQDYLAKPFDPEELLAAVRDVVWGAPLRS